MGYLLGYSRKALSTFFLWLLRAMAEEVIQGLENMKLTTEEEEIIEVPDEGRRRSKVVRKV